MSNSLKRLQSRRSFLIQGAGSVGAWLVTANLARQIEALAQINKPYLVEVERPEVKLFAEDPAGCGEYCLTLDRSYNDCEYPSFTYREWFERNEVDFQKPAEVRDYLASVGEYDPDEDEPFEMPDLDWEISERLMNRYIEWDWVMHDSETARAFSYLNRLKLGQRNAIGPEVLGRLKFYDGPGMCNNSRLVCTEDVAVLGGLHQRLLQLGERVSLTVC